MRVRSPELNVETNTVSTVDYALKQPTLMASKPSLVIAVTQGASLTDLGEKPANRYQPNSVTMTLSMA